MLLLIAYIEVARIRSANAHRFFHHRALLVQNTYNLSQEIECKLKIPQPQFTDLKEIYLSLSSSLLSLTISFDTKC